MEWTKVSRSEALAGISQEIGNAIQALGIAASGAHCIGEHGVCDLITREESNLRVIRGGVQESRLLKDIEDA